MYVAPFIVCGLLAQMPPAAQVPRAPRTLQQAPHEPAAAIDGGKRSESPPSANSESPADREPSDGQAPAAPGASAAGKTPAGHAAEANQVQASGTNGPLVPVEPRVARLTAADIMHAALAVPEGEKPRGQPLGLVEVLRSVADRAGQLRATEIYWRLAEALADYNFSWDEYQQLARLKPATAPEQKLAPDQQMLATRLAAAKARVQDADVALVAAQFDLAGAIRLPAGQPLPLPADAPHVGPYRTVLDQIYVGRAIPARAVLIDRTLPIRRGAIDARAAAIQAATDALAAAEEAHYEGRSDLSLVLTLVDELAQQRRMLVADIRTYNNEIAEYAMTAPTPALDPQGLASMLIKPSTPSRDGVVAGGAVTSPGFSGGVERAGFTTPLGSNPASPLQPVAEGQTKLAPPPVRGEPTLAPPKPGQPAAGGAPAAKPHRGAADGPSEQPYVPPNSAMRGTQRRAQRPETPDLATRAGGAAGDALGARPECLYPALQQMKPEDQARQLALVLCWEPATVAADVAPISLTDYLSTVSAERRREALAAYWHCEFYTARAQALAQQVEQYEALGAVIGGGALEGADDTLASATLLVRAAKLAAEADVRRAQADRLAAQWTITTFVGRPLAGAWLSAETPPHAGGYRLQLGELSRELRDSPVVQRLAAVIPQLRRTIADRAASVVSADQARVAFAIGSDKALTETQRAVRAIHEQTAETMAFLARLTDYNVEIAAYANAVLPPATTSESLVRALVTTQPAASRVP